MCQSRQLGWAETSRDTYRKKLQKHTQTQRNRAEAASAVERGILEKGGARGSMWVPGNKSKASGLRSI